MGKKVIWNQEEYEVQPWGGLKRVNPRLRGTVDDLNPANIPLPPDNDAELAGENKRGRTDSMDPTTDENKRLRGSTDTQIQGRAIDMDVDDTGPTYSNGHRRFGNEASMSSQGVSPPQALARSAGTAQSNRNQGQETQPDYSLPRELGVFTETRTAHLPLKLYGSFNKITKTYTGTGEIPNQLRIRMNTPYNPLKGTTLYRQTYGSPSVPGFSANMTPNSTAENPNVANRQWPFTFQTVASAN